MAIITEEMEDEMLELLATGKTQREIAKKVGVTEGAIRWRLNSPNHKDFRDDWYTVSASTGKGLLSLLMLPKREIVYGKDGEIVSIKETHDPGGRALEIMDRVPTFLKALNALYEEETETETEEMIDLDVGWDRFEKSEALRAESGNGKDNPTDRE